MNLYWLTDPHLNFVERQTRVSLATNIRSLNPDCILCGGDIGEAPSFAAYLTELADIIASPLYFVLGNHDFYRGSIATVQTTAARLDECHPNLVWLDRAGVVPLSEKTALIGHSAWADGRCGDFWNSAVRLNDFALIQELRWTSKEEIFVKLNRLGDEAAAYLDSTLKTALLHFKQVVLLTHVPPFAASCWHEGKISTPEYLPFFACQTVGQILKAIMAAHPDQQLLVLCGHTHSSGEAQILPNLRVLTGGAQYGYPELQKALDLDLFFL